MWAYKPRDFPHHKYPLLSIKNGSLPTAHLHRSQTPVAEELRGKERSFQPEGPVPLCSELLLTSAWDGTQCPANPCFYLELIGFGTGCPSGRLRLKMQFSIFIKKLGQISDLMLVFKPQKVWSYSDTGFQVSSLLVRDTSKIQSPLQIEGLGLDTLPLVFVWTSVQEQQKVVIFTLSSSWLFKEYQEIWRATPEIKLYSVKVNSHSLEDSHNHLFFANKLS